MGDSETAARPLVVDLGRAASGDLAALRDGNGPLAAEIDEVVDRVREALGDRAADRELLPVVVVYRTEPEETSR